METLDFRGKKHRKGQDARGREWKEGMQSFEPDRSLAAGRLDSQHSCYSKTEGSQEEEEEKKGVKIQS